MARSSDKNDNSSPSRPARTVVRQGVPPVTYRLYAKGAVLVTETLDGIRATFEEHGGTVVVDRFGEYDADLTEAAYAALGVNLNPLKNAHARQYKTI